MTEDNRKYGPSCQGAIYKYLTIEPLRQDEDEDGDEDENDDPPF